MFQVLFIGIGGVANCALSTIVQFRRYHHSLTIPLFALSLIFAFQSLVGILWFDSPISTMNSFYSHAFIITLVAGTVMIHEIAISFLRTTKEHADSKVRSSAIQMWVLRFVCFCISIYGCFIPLANTYAIGSLILQRFTPGGFVLISLALILSIFSLYHIENTYRYSQRYQKKITRLCVLSLLIITFFNIYLSGYVLLFRFISIKQVILGSVVYGLAFPIFLLGLLRYRLGSERVSIPRDTVYSSFALILTGSAFTGIGLLTLAFKSLHIDFAYFERTLLACSLFVFSALVFGSGEMRKRIIHFVNNQFYSIKYDYRDQFFRLHRSLVSSIDLKSAIDELIENMKYTVTVDDAFVFLFNSQDGNFYIHENKERATGNSYFLKGDSEYIKKIRIQLVDVPINVPGNLIWVDKPFFEDSTLDFLKVDSITAISHSGQLLGLLTFRQRGKSAFDREDKVLVQVFANSIGDTIYKNKILTQQIEAKQFDSFTHISSFIIHDIKNQVATLSLLLKNGDRHIANPDFQKSILSSVKNCTDNLKQLIEKFQSPPKQESLVLKVQDINAVLGSVLENTTLATVDTVKYIIESTITEMVAIDFSSLFYIIKNLLVNALEAISYTGEITIIARDICKADLSVIKQFNISCQIFSKYKVYIIIKDNGPGMSKDFIQNHLFHPFSTTKDKGIGIGLYQCKTLIEKMNGKIICHSQVGVGTIFCLLL